MKVEHTINQERHEATLDVWVEKERFEQAKRRAAREISKEVSIPGFRRGKAPYEIVVRFVGEETILHQALDEILDEVYSEALEQADLQTIGMATLEKYEFTPQGELHVTFSVLLQPEVVLPEDYRQLRIPLPEVDEEEVEKRIFQVQLDSATLEPVDRGAQWGDAVDVQLSFKGETRGFRLYLSPSVKDAEDNNPLFHSLIGRRSGEEYELESNQEGESTKVKLLSVYATTLPTIEEVAKIFGLSSEEAFRQLVREFIQYGARLEHGEKVLEELRTRTRFAYSQKLVEGMAKDALEKGKEDVSEFGITWEEFLQQVGVRTEEEYLEQWLVPIVRRITERILLTQEIILREEIGADPEELTERIEEILEDYEKENPVRFRKLLKDQKFAETVFRQASTELLEEKVKLFLSDLASGALERREQEAAAAQVSEPQQAEQPVEEQVPAVAQADEWTQDQPSAED